MIGAKHTPRLVHMEIFRNCVLILGHAHYIRYGTTFGDRPRYPVNSCRAVERHQGLPYGPIKSYIPHYLLFEVFCALCTRPMVPSARTWSRTRLRGRWGSRGCQVESHPRTIQKMPEGCTTMSDSKSNYICMIRASLALPAACRSGVLLSREVVRIRRRRIRVIRTGGSSGHGNDERGQTATPLAPKAAGGPVVLVITPSRHVTTLITPRTISDMLDTPQSLFPRK